MLDSDLDPSLGLPRDFGELHCSHPARLQHRGHHLEYPVRGGLLSRFHHHR